MDIHHLAVEADVPEVAGNDRYDGMEQLAIDDVQIARQSPQDATSTRISPSRARYGIVGRIDLVGAGVIDLRASERVEMPWFGHADGTCPYCRSNRETLCDAALFTGRLAVSPAAISMISAVISS